MKRDQTHQRIVDAVLQKATERYPGTLALAGAVHTDKGRGCLCETADAAAYLEEK